MSDKPETSAKAVTEENEHKVTWVDALILAGGVAVVGTAGFLAGRFFGGETVVEATETASELFS